MKNIPISFRFLSILLLITLKSSNGFSQKITLTLQPSDFHGYNISCFGGRDGSIDLTVNGGIAPYDYKWSNEQSTEDIYGLSAQYYRVYVRDANGEEAEAEITLTEPEPFKMEVMMYSYPNGYNISLFGACNGQATAMVYGGVLPVTYIWSDGGTGQSRANLCARNYGVIATDNNGCKVASEKVFLSEPAESHWTQTGNGGTDPAINYIGTSDNKDFVLKTNGAERLRLTAGGSLKLLPLAGGGIRNLSIDNDGVLTALPCLTWNVCGNNLATTDYFGSNNNIDIVFKANAQEILRLRRTGKISIKSFFGQPNGLLFTDNLGDINKLNFDAANSTKFLSAAGTWQPLPAGSGVWGVNNTSIYCSNTVNVGIGASNPQKKLQIDHNSGTGPDGIAINNTSGTNNANSEINFMKTGSALWSIGCDVRHDGGNNFFVYDNQTNSQIGATRFIIDGEGRVGINTVPTTTGTFYKLYVEGGITARDLLVTINTFPDYVFSESYPLRSLVDLDNYIQKNHHLPGMPSAKEVQEENGFQVGKTIEKLVEQNEEQALYIIDLQKQIDQLRILVNKK